MATAQPLVGRRRESATIANLISAGVMVAVVGEAGIGKTALVSSVLADRPHLSGGALALLSSRPYLALERALAEELTGAVEDVASCVYAKAGGRVLFIDDVHWANSLTLDVLDVLRTVLPVVVTSRRSYDETGLRRLKPDHTLTLEALTPSSALALANRLHPDLSGQDRARLLDLAAGNPLLLKTLIEGTVVSPTLIAAIDARLSALDAATRDALRKLALLGRPAPRSLVCVELAHLDTLIALVDGDYEFRHPLIGEAVAMVLDQPTQRRLHRELADAIDMHQHAEIAQHLVKAGCFAEARTRAEAALVDAGLSTRASLYQLIAQCSVALGEPGDGQWVRAAEALVDAGQLSDALVATEHVRPASRLHAEARLQAGRARWFGSDVVGARAEFDEALRETLPGDDDLRVRILIESTYLAVRDRQRGLLDVARSTFDLAAESPHRHRAGACLGAAMLYEGVPGWDELLSRVAAEAHRDGDLEVSFAAAFHLASGLGFVGRFQEAVDFGATQVKLAEAAGLHTWAAQFLAAEVFTRAQMAEDPVWVLDQSLRFLRSRRLSRNRFQLEHSAVSALSDLGRTADAMQRLERFQATALGPEAQMLAACTAAELAWVHADDGAMARALLATRSLGAAWFGIGVSAEAAAAVLAFERDEPFEAVPPTTTLPVMWTSLHEIEGARRAAAGDLVGALSEFDMAAGRWHGTHPRYEIRCLEAGSVAARRLGRRDASARHHQAVSIAREYSLQAHLHRLGAALDPRLTKREESILRLVAAGRTTGEITTAMNLKRSTVDAHIESALIKLGASSRREAADIVTRADSSS